MIILKWISKKWDGRAWDRIQLAQDKDTLVGGDVVNMVLNLRVL